WAGMPIADAIGWTLLHSLWEGAVLATALAATLAAMRSARARYAAACTALVILLIGLGVTFLRLMPAGSSRGPGAVIPLARAWAGVPTSNFPLHSNSPLAQAAPWLAAFWIIGVAVFYLVQGTSWISASALRRRGVCFASSHWQKEVARLG